MTKILVDKLLRYGILAISLVVFVHLSILSVSAAEDTSIVTIEVEETECVVRVRAIPEKRLPDTGNWSTLLRIEILTLNNASIGVVEDIRTDDQGIGIIDICEEELELEDGESYNFFVKGLSHLRKFYPNVQVNIGLEELTDFSDNNNTENLMLAGETSVVFDNYINSLDISTQINSSVWGVINEAHSDLNHERNDLNREGKVNSLDISNTTFNYRLVGD